MKSLKCPSCGAPIEIEEDAVVQVCEHCGTNLAPTRNLRLGGFRREREVDVHVVDLRGLRPRMAPAKALGCSLLTVLLIAGLGGFVAWRSFTVQRSVQDSIRNATRSFGEIGKALRTDGPLPVAKLAEPSFAGRHRIAAAPPPGSLAAFDPVAALPWALSLAQTWSADVKLERIDVERVRPDGTVNVADDADAEVTYRFVSPRRFEAFRERANLEKDPRGDHEFWIELEKGQIFAYELSTLSAFASDREAAEIAALTWPKSRTLAEIFAGAGRRKPLPDVPFFKGYLIRLDDEGWCWYLSTLSGSPSIDRIRARDGRQWPY